MNDLATSALWAGILWLATIGLVTIGFVIAAVIKKIKADKKRRDREQAEFRRVVIAGVMNELRKTNQKGGRPTGPIAS